MFCLHEYTRNILCCKGVCVLGKQRRPGLLNPSHKSHNALNKYPTMDRFVTEMCTHVHFCYRMVHCGIWSCYNVGFVQQVSILTQYFTTDTTTLSREGTKRRILLIHGMLNALLYSSQWCMRYRVMLARATTFTGFITFTRSVFRLFQVQDFQAALAVADELVNGNLSTLLTQVCFIHDN